MMADRTVVMRFVRRRRGADEIFAARWVEQGAALLFHARSFTYAASFRAWLLDELGYGGEEADTLIAQLRAPVSSSLPPHRPVLRRRPHSDIVSPNEPSRVAEWLSASDAIW